MIQRYLPFSPLLAQFKICPTTCVPRSRRQLRRSTNQVVGDYRISSPNGRTSTPYTWASLLTKLKLDRVQSALQTPEDVARLLAASTDSASCLYDCIPSSRDGTRLSDTTLSLAVGLRLELPVATSGICACGAELDPHGDHALSCNRGVGRGARHTALNEDVRSALNEAGHVCVVAH